MPARECCLFDVFAFDVSATLLVIPKWFLSTFMTVQIRSEIDRDEMSQQKIEENSQGEKPDHVAMGIHKSLFFEEAPLCKVNGVNCCVTFCQHCTKCAHPHHHEGTALPP